ncbi:MAG: PilZ domain-containing protein [Spirochaetales bacterium]
MSQRFLLQQDIQFFAEPDPAQNTIALIVFAGLVLLGIILAALNARSSGGGKGGGGVRRLLREARKLGLPAEQRQELRELVRELRLQNPHRLLSNAAYLNHALKRRMDQIDTLNLPEPAREQKKALLFGAKRQVDNSSQRKNVLPTSRNIRVGQMLRITMPSGNTYELMVASNLLNGLGVELPRGRHDGAEFKKGAVIKVGIVFEGGKLFSYTSRIIGVTNVRGTGVMYIQHAANIPQTQQRRSPRREYNSPCYFFPVTVVTVGKGKRAQKQAFVNKNQRMFGRFEDLSAGGCAVRTQAPPTAGTILRLDFEGVDGVPVSVYGMVRSVERRRARGRLMHIKFTRVSRKHLNTIQSYVYGLANG